MLDEEYKDKDVKEVKVVETRMYFDDVGDLTLTYDLNSNSITEIQEKLVSAEDAKELASDSKVVEILNTIHARQDEKMSKVLGATGRNLDGRWEEL